MVPYFITKNDYSRERCRNKNKLNKQVGRNLLDWYKSYLIFKTRHRFCRPIFFLMQQPENEVPKKQIIRYHWFSWVAFLFFILFVNLVEILTLIFINRIDNGLNNGSDPFQCKVSLNFKISTGAKLSVLMNYSVLIRVFFFLYSA